jgi:hypothetical protein
MWTVPYRAGPEPKPAMLARCVRCVIGAARRRPGREAGAPVAVYRTVNDCVMSAFELLPA